MSYRPRAGAAQLNRGALGCGGFAGLRAMYAHSRVLLACLLSVGGTTSLAHGQACGTPTHNPRRLIVWGRVTDDSSRLPLAEVNVWVRQTAIAVATDSTGRYRVCVMISGSTHLRVVACGHTPADRAVPEAGDSVEMDFQLSRDSSVKCVHVEPIHDVPPPQPN